MERRQAVFRAFAFHETGLVWSREGKGGRKSKGDGPVPLKLKVATARDNLLSFRLSPSTTATTAAAPTRLPLCTALFHRTPDIDWPRLSPSRYNNSVENDFPTGRIARLRDSWWKEKNLPGKDHLGKGKWRYSRYYMVSKVNVWTEFKMWVRKFG